MGVRQEQCMAPADLALETVQEWTLWLTEVERWLMPHFPRRAARHRAWASSRGWLSPVERNNGWQWAEVNGDATPYGVQHLLGRARWDAEAVRDDLRAYLVAHLGNPEAVLGLDATGFLKTGQHAAGVARPYSGTAGRMENGQIGVFLAYASQPGMARLAGARYLPQAWTNDGARCERAGVPETQPFATKPQWARQRLQRAFDARLPAAWVTGDSVYGHERRRRMWLEEPDHASVMAVSGNAYVWRAGGQPQVKTIMTTLAAEGWCRLRAGHGAQGPRWYDWRWLPLVAPLSPHWRRGLLVRRSLSDPMELTASVVFAPPETTLATVVHGAGSRWTIEQCCEEAKGEGGLDQYEIRSWTGWDRHITLAMSASALLTVLRAANLPQAALSKNMSQGSPLSSLTVCKAARGLGCR
jgi:SRSO17 transposase